jgi:hypothetical protein
MRYKLIFAAALTLVLLAVGGGPAAELDQGAENMMLDGGRQGQVAFGHHRHQAALGDCGLCHDLFPQEAGSIQRLKTQGQLKPKSDVMNKLCIKCHRARKNAGETTGPLTCATCHQR